MKKGYQWVGFWVEKGIIFKASTKIYIQLLKLRRNFDENLNFKGILTSSYMWYAKAHSFRNESESTTRKMLLSIWKSFWPCSNASVNAVNKSKSSEEMVKGKTYMYRYEHSLCSCDFRWQWIYEFMVWIDGSTTFTLFSPFIFGC